MRLGKTAVPTRTHDTPRGSKGPLRNKSSSQENLDPANVSWAITPLHQILVAAEQDAAIPLRTSWSAALHLPSPRMPRSIRELHELIRSVGRDGSILPALSSRAFPLSADHKLITLVQYNVLRGMVTNICILSLQDQILFDCGYNLNIVPVPSRLTSRPRNFEPTEIQKTINHSAWIDTVPCSQLRDNLILRLDRQDLDDFCGDLVGGVYDGFDDVEVRGIMLWGEPWSVDGWEVSVGFLERWGFLLRGCRQMMDATNRWRGLRGEDRLVFPM